MSEHGAVLQVVNQELVKCLEELKARRYTLQQTLELWQEKRNDLMAQKQTLEQRLAETETAIKNKSIALRICERIIYDAERGFVKIVETSQGLLNTAQKESFELSKAEEALPQPPID